MSGMSARRGAGISFALGVSLCGGSVGWAAADNPFRLEPLAAGYMLAADRFVPVPSEGKKDGEGALCAGQMGSDRDKSIEEGRCAYTDPDAPAPEEQDPERSPSTSDPGTA